MIKVLSLFSGYGGSEFALSKAEIPHEIIGYSDIEDCANYIYKLNHCPNDVNDKLKLGDITKIDAEDLEDFDLLTAGWPCTPFSIAGKREGFKNDKSGNLFFEVIRILNAKKPRFFLGENVEGILSHDDGETMRVVLRELRKIGYHVHWKKLYSKEHGTPQNRPRIWFACFRDYDDFIKFDFPEPEPLKVLVKDLLEEEVDEKYYLNENQLRRIYETMNREHNFQREPQDLDKPFRTLTAHMERDNLDVPYFNEATIYNSAHTGAQGSRFKTDGCSFTLEATKSQSLCIADFRYDEGIRPRKDGISPTLTCTQKEGEGLSAMPILYDVYNKKLNNNNISSTLGQNCGTITGISGQVIITGLQEHQKMKDDGVCSTLNSAIGLGGGHTPIINTITTGYGRQGSSKEFKEISKQIKNAVGVWRRLTPRECFRLMGFFDDEIEFGNLRDSKLYFLAGNGWDVRVAAKIFTQMFKGNQNKQKGVFDY